MYIPVVAASYGASKSALIGLTRALAGEGGPYGVTANSVAPGLVTTALSSVGDDDGVARDAFVGASPLGRAGRPEEIAAVVAFLASDASSYVNGAVLDANGGIFG
jgi:NAD(P)-dependent dehydrogenase (short-subunit alcohol dehydrogenase family)